ncbi:uncharacterized protein LOC121428156 isoform X2 [Lytechinus variegatus]|uniref:uncharacterized protein LOC121428156 isoform X2 n=1 Tax=Lytechinus variegatus TaxID=7654 RepID=UPI001BB0F26B|nr:uncharacterized protein LOC121428156 isoform X2 [Lytechinus variegatus]
MDISLNMMDGNETPAVRECIRPAPFGATDFNPVLQAHCYILGTVFNFLAVTAAFFLYRLVKIKAHPLVITVNTLLVIMATLRYIYLTFDPYNIRMKFPMWFVQLLEDLALPCLTSAFAIIQYALYQLCKIQRPNKSMQSKRVLWGIVVCHFAFVIVIDILLITKVAGCWLAMLCQIFTLVWGLALCLTVSILAFKLVSRDKRVKRTLRGDHEPRLESGNQQSPTPNGMQVEDPADKKKLKDHLKKLKRICYSASVTGFLCFIVSLIGLFLIISPAINYEVGKVGWLCYQTTQRLVEIAFGFILLYGSTGDR